ncbi:fimbrial protein [Enterobacteriaceae bacterium 89]|nr:fimbrial protein [Enterobacteriaceae bacterium 89]
MRVKNCLALVATGITLLIFAGIPVSAQASITVLHNCFSTQGNYTTNYTQSLEPADNTSGKSIDIADHFIASGAPLTASCDCPGNFSATSTVYELSAAGSPLAAGISGFGYLTGNLDVDVSGYSDAIDSPDGNGLFPLAIDSYPTTQSGMKSKLESKLQSSEGEQDVCSDASRPKNAASTKRQFIWNVMALTFYIKKPILGEEVIPSTLVVQNYVCLYFGSGSCDTSNLQLVSNIWLSGSLTAPLSCTINAGSTIEVDLGNIVNSQFVSPGLPPSGYTLKNVDISYHCDDPAIGNSDKIKLTLSADQGVAPGSSGLIAKMLNRDDIGVRMYGENNGNVSLDGSVALPVNIDEQGNGALHFTAAPVSTTSKRPEPGKFEGNVTVKMDLR